MSLTAIALASACGRALRTSHVGRAPTRLALRAVVVEAGLDQGVARGGGSGGPPRWVASGRARRARAGLLRAPGVVAGEDVQAAESSQHHVLVSVPERR